MDWHPVLVRTFTSAEHAIIVYVGVINTIYLLLMALSYFAFRFQPGRLTRTESDTVLRSPLVPAISLIAPAYNERATICESVRAMLNLHYPKHEVIVVNDGSTDDTLQILIEEFHLYRSSRTPSGTIPTAPIRTIYEARTPIRLVVVDKENGGGKADALNAALNVARTPLVAALDSDSLIEGDALLSVVKPFLDDPHTLAAGGIIRVANGCAIEYGRVTGVAAPASSLPRFQVVEYLRAFLHGRTAFSFFNSMLLISGAFGVFRRDALLSIGGYDTTTVGEDMEIVIRLHRRWRERREPYRIVFVPDPVCWTQVPDSWKSLQIQRNRWQRGSVESLWRHRTMFGNPRFGVVGLLGFPYFVLVEMVAPIVEALGYGVMMLGLLLRLISVELALLFLTVSVLFGILISVSAVLLEDFTARRYRSVRDIVRLMWAAVVENLGFRQVLTIWRAQGLVDGIRGKTGWGTVERRGFRPA